MAVSKVSDLNSLFNNVFEISKFTLEQRAMMPEMVFVRNAQTMAPRVLSTYAQHTAGTIAEGGTASPTTQSKSADGTITPQIVHHMIQLTDEQMMTDPDGAVRSQSINMGNAIARKVDTDLVGEFANFSSSKGTAGSALTLANVTAAMAVLQANNVMGRIHGVVHPYQWHDLSNQFTSVNSNPVSATANDVVNEAMRDYFVSRHLGAFWYTNSNIGTGTAKKGGLFEMEAIMLDVRTPYTLTQEREEKTRSEEFHGVIRYGHGVNRDEAGVALLSDASEPS